MVSAPRPCVYGSRLVAWPGSGAATRARCHLSALALGLLLSRLCLGGCARTRAPSPTRLVPLTPVRVSSVRTLPEFAATAKKKKKKRNSALPAHPERTPPPLLPLLLLTLSLILPLPVKHQSVPTAHPTAQPTDDSPPPRYPDGIRRPDGQRPERPLDCAPTEHRLHRSARVRGERGGGGLRATTAVSFVASTTTTMTRSTKGATLMAMKMKCSL